MGGWRGRGHRYKHGSRAGSWAIGRASGWAGERASGWAGGRAGGLSCGRVGGRAGGWRGGARSGTLTLSLGGKFGSSFASSLATLASENSRLTVPFVTAGGRASEAPEGSTLVTARMLMGASAREEGLRWARPVPDGPSGADVVLWRCPIADVVLWLCPITDQYRDAEVCAFTRTNGAGTSSIALVDHVMREQTS